MSLTTKTRRMSIGAALSKNLSMNNLKKEMRKSFKLGNGTTSDSALEQKLKNIWVEEFDEDDDSEPKGNYLTETLGSNRKYFKNTKISQQIEYLEG